MTGDMPISRIKLDAREFAPEAPSMPSIMPTSDKKVGRSFKKEAPVSSDDGGDDGEAAEGLEAIAEDLADALEAELARPDNHLRDLFADHRDALQQGVTPFDRFEADLQHLMDIEAHAVAPGEAITLDIGQGRHQRATLPETHQTLILEVRSLRFILLISNQLTPADLLESASTSLAQEVENIAITHGLQVAYLELQQWVLSVAMETLPSR